MLKFTHQFVFLILFLSCVLVYKIALSLQSEILWFVGLFLPQHLKMVAVANLTPEWTGWCLNWCGGISSGNLKNHRACVTLELVVPVLKVYLSFFPLLSWYTYCIIWLSIDTVSLMSCVPLSISDSSPRSIVLPRSRLTLLQLQLVRVPLLRQELNWRWDGKLFQEASCFLSFWFSKL